MLGPELPSRVQDLFFFSIRGLWSFASCRQTKKTLLPSVAAGDVSNSRKTNNCPVRYAPHEAPQNSTTENKHTGKMAQQKRTGNRPRLEQSEPISEWKRTQERQESLPPNTSTSDGTAGKIRWDFAFLGHTASPEAKIIWRTIAKKIRDHKRQQTISTVFMLVFGNSTSLV